MFGRRTAAEHYQWIVDQVQDAHAENRKLKRRVEKLEEIATAQASAWVNRPRVPENGCEEY